MVSQHTVIKDGSNQKILLNQPCKQLNRLLTSFDNECVGNDKIVAIANLQHCCNNTAISRRGNLGSHCVQSRMYRNKTAHPI